MIDLTKRVAVLTELQIGLADKPCRSLIAAEIAVCDRILAAARDGEGAALDDWAKLERVAALRHRACYALWYGQLQRGRIS